MAELMAFTLAVLGVYGHSAYQKVEVKAMGVEVAPNTIERTTTITRRLTMIERTKKMRTTRTRMIRKTREKMRTMVRTRKAMTTMTKARQAPQPRLINRVPQAQQALAHPLPLALHHHALRNVRLARMTTA